LWASIISLRQTDLKKIIAYSSVVHMNFTLIGLLLLTTYGICGSLISCISHGFISGALFFCSGMLYDRYNTRNLIYFGGLSKILPLFSVIFFIFIIGNFGFPGFISFIGEILIIFSMPIKSVIFTIILASGLIFSTVYTMWIYDHIFNGSIKIISSYSDLNRLEFWLLLPLLITSLLFGIYPIVILDRLVFSVEVLTILI
jgi:NADH-quinone oxidoreductase subunit M